MRYVVVRVRCLREFSLATIGGTHHVTNRLETDVASNEFAYTCRDVVRNGTGIEIRNYPRTFAYNKTV